MGAKSKRARAILKQQHPVLPSPADIVAARSRTGGWTWEQLAKWGVKCPPRKGWRERLEAEWYRANGETRPEPLDASERGPHGSDCSVCGRRQAPIVITRGMADDGTLNVFNFCSDPCKWRWQHDHPFP